MVDQTEKNNRGTSFPIFCAALVSIASLTCNLVGLNTGVGWAHGFPLTFAERPNLISVTNGKTADSLTSGKGKPIVNINGELTLPSYWLFDPPSPSTLRITPIIFNSAIGFAIIIGAYLKARQLRYGRVCFKIADLFVAVTVVGCIFSFRAVIMCHGDILFVCSLFVLTGAILATIWTGAGSLTNRRTSWAAKKP